MLDTFLNTFHRTGVTIDSPLEESFNNYNLEDFDNLRIFGRFRMGILKT